jgi:hypothetical protein
MQPVWEKLFICVSGWLLAATGSAKLISFTEHTNNLLTTDPIMQMQFRHLFFIMGIIELVVAILCLTRMRSNLSLIAIAWLSTCLLVYRLSMHWVGWRSPCPCLGNFVDLLHIPPKLADLLMVIVVMYLLIGSYACLLKRWRIRISSSLSSEK